MTNLWLPPGSHIVGLTAKLNAQADRGNKLNIFLISTDVGTLFCSAKQTKVSNISYKFFYTIRWLIRRRRRVESKVSSSLLRIHPFRIMQSLLQHLIMLVLSWAGEKNFAHKVGGSAKTFTFRCYRLQRAHINHFPRIYIANVQNGWSGQ